MKNPTSRFSDRVNNYIKYRPSYPPDILILLKTECGLTGEWVVADLGSGTGILSRLLLENGNRVLGVEPNAEMREAAERSLGGNPLFTSVAVRAEETGLATASVDLIVAAQAFHWFDAEKSRAEFLRILGRLGGLDLERTPGRYDTLFARLRGAVAQARHRLRLRGSPQFRR